jgi:hypothetical protein
VLVQYAYRYMMFIARHPSAGYGNDAAITRLVPRGAPSNATIICQLLLIVTMDRYGGLSPVPHTHNRLGRWRSSSIPLPPSSCSPAASATPMLGGVALF